LRFGRSISLALGGAMAAGCGTDSCFVAGTRVATPSGLIPIEDLRAGDVVFAWSFDRGAAVERRILHPRRYRRDPPRHPVWRAAATGDARAPDLGCAQRDLATGRRPRKRRMPGWFPDTHPKHLDLVSATETPGHAAVYNLTVEEEENFFAEGVLVHNKTYERTSLRSARWTSCGWSPIRRRWSRSRRSWRRVSTRSFPSWMGERTFTLACSRLRLTPQTPTPDSSSPPKASPLSLRATMTL